MSILPQPLEPASGFIGIYERCRRHCGLSPAEMHTLASGAKNGKKYLRLYYGNMTGYPTWAKAAQALAQIFAFYIGDPDILATLVKLSPLGLARRKDWAAIGHEISAMAIKRQGKRRYRKPEPVRDHIINTLAGRRARKAKPKAEYTLRELVKSCHRPAEEIKSALEYLINEGLVSSRYVTTKHRQDPTMYYRLVEAF